MRSYLNVWLYTGMSLRVFGNIDDSVGVAIWGNLVSTFFFRRWILFLRSNPESVSTRTDLGEIVFTTLAGLVLSVFSQNVCPCVKDVHSLAL